MMEGVEGNGKRQPDFCVFGKKGPAMGQVEVLP